MLSSKATVRPVRASKSASVRRVCQPSQLEHKRGPATCIRAYTSAAPGQAAEAAQQSFLDAAVTAVLSWFDDEQERSTSEELQLPPELRAYLEELEADGSHGGWGHSHIAERLASTSEDFSE